MTEQRDWHFHPNIVEMSLEALLKLKHEAWEIYDVDYDWLAQHVDNVQAFCDDEDAPVSGLMIYQVGENKWFLYASEAEYIVQDIIDYYRSKEPIDQSDPIGNQIDPECPSSPLVGFL